MVKLKSFKPIEPIEPIESAQDESRLSGRRGVAVAPLDLDEVRQGHVNNETDQLRTSDSVSSSSSAKSTKSLGSGGNLTLDTRSEVSLKLNERSPDREPAIGVRSSTAASSTLSSNEEFQSAHIELNEEDEEEGDETVSKIEIEHVKRPTAASPKGPLSHSGVSKSEQNSPSIKSTMRLQQQRIANQQQQQAHSNSPLNTPGLIRSAKMLNMPRSQTSPSPLSQMVGKLTRSTGGVGVGKLSSQLNSNDSASQFSLHLKYQGSNHFEIRWQNLRLFAQPKSRLPQFVSGNKVFQFVFGNSKATSSSLNLEATGGELGPKPPLSPLMHKIPPTIDENLEMKCTNKTTPSLEGASNISTTFAPTPVPAHIQAQHTPAPSDTLTTIATASASSSTRCILNNISGQVFSGQMTAILGPSGVGKTSLLNSLTGRNTLEGTGRVSLIGALQSKRMCVVTVPQVDVLPNKLTVNEDLQFTSRLKNPQANFDHQRNIDRLVKHLHMDKFLHTRIQKLSGGEARRLSIARELLSSPDILILDEPTSGLDANTCKKIITALRDIVEHSDNILDKPMSIIITIHQPQQEVYQLFHRVYVMATGGRVVYEGSPQLLMPTMLEFSSVSRIAGELQIQLNENPAIVAIEVASGEFGAQVIEELAQHHESQVYEEFLGLGFGSPLTAGTGGNSAESPMLTPLSLRLHRSPMSVSRFDVQLHRKRLNSLGDVSLGRGTPVMSRRTTTGQQQQQAPPPPQWDRVSQITSISYASTYDADLPEQTSKLKVDKRLRRSVVMKSHFISHTLTLIRRCWLLTTRDLFLMSIRILGFLLVAGGTVQIFSNALDPNEHQCPQFITEVDDMPDYFHHVKLRLMNLLEMLRQGNSTHLLFFHLLLCIVMVTSALAGLVFPLQMRMFIREYKNGWYSPASFITSQTIAELPADIIGPLITLLIAYPLCHQPDSLYHWRLICYCLVFILSSIICKSQAQIVGAFLMDSVENSVFISCVAVTPAALLSGVPLRIEQMIAPLRLISYGSFLRYAFESLLELRYGYDMCPCDSSLVNGPLRASLQAVPPHLENLATGLLELSLPTGPNGTVAATTTIGIPTGGELTATALAENAAIGQTEHENVFIKFLRLVTNAGNMFTTESEYTDCERYRSLYLINMGIQSNTLVRWLIVMLLMFVVSRFITYFAVRTVIRLRRT